MTSVSLEHAREPQPRCFGNLFRRSSSKKKEPAQPASIDQPPQPVSAKGKRPKRAFFRGRGGDAHVLDLPDEVLASVFRLLPIKDVMAVAGTCCQFRKCTGVVLGEILCDPESRKRVKSPEVILKMYNLVKEQAGSLPKVLSLEGSGASDEVVHSLLTVYVRDEMDKSKLKDKAKKKSPWLQPKTEVPFSSLIPIQASTSPSSSSSSSSTGSSVPSIINLSNLPNVTWVSLSHVSRHVGPALRVLHLRNCAKVDNVGIQAIADACPRLAELDLQGLIKVTDSAFVSLIHSCKATLTAISLMGCSRVTNATLVALSHCSELKALNLSGNTNLTSVADLLPLTGLMAAWFDFCNHMTDNAAVARLVAGNPDLRVLSLRNCSGLSMLPLLRAIEDGRVARLQQSSVAGGKPYVFKFIGTRAAGPSTPAAPAAAAGPSSSNNFGPRVGIPLALTSVVLRGMQTGGLDNLRDVLHNFCVSAPNLVSLDLSVSAISSELLSTGIPRNHPSLRVVEVTGTNVAWSTLNQLFPNTRFISL